MGTRPKDPMRVGRKNYKAYHKRKERLFLVRTLCVMGIFVLVLIGVKKLTGDFNPSGQQTSQAGTQPGTSLANTVSKQKQEIYQGDLILVNAEQVYHQNDQQNLVSILEHKTNSYKVKDRDVLIDQRIVSSLNEMLDDFVQATNTSDLIIISGYRTQAKQKQLYDADLIETGLADSKMVSKAGYRLSVRLRTTGRRIHGKQQRIPLV